MSPRVRHRGRASAAIVVFAALAAGCSSSTPSRSTSASSSSRSSTTTTGAVSPSSTAAPAASTTTTSTSSPSLATTTTAAAGTSPEQAIALYLAEQGLEYAGDCATTNLAEDSGKWCSSLLRDGGSARAYAVGPTFAEYQYALRIELGAGGWSATGTEALPGAGSS